MHPSAPIAVLGLYNSGSTALAGALHRLGVHMGPPFWINSDDTSKRNFYEPWDLACQLRYWWNEPEICENTSRATRITCLANWLRMRQCIHKGTVGAKHPLLCLCGDDLVTAWGADTIFLRAWRPLNESIERLRVRNWYPNREDQLQRRLWNALEGFCAKQTHMAVDFGRLKSETAAVLAEIIAYAQLTPTNAQKEAAIAFIGG